MTRRLTLRDLDTSRPDEDPSDEAPQTSRLREEVSVTTGLAPLGAIPRSLQGAARKRAGVRGKSPAGESSVGAVRPLRTGEQEEHSEPPQLSENSRTSPGREQRRQMSSAVASAAH